jgi:hypothetical protein
MESSHTTELDIPELNAAASKAHVFPGMANHSLISVGQLCVEGYIVTFKQDTVTICDSGNSQILSGPLDLNTGLWRINLRQTNNHKPEPIANNVYALRNTGALVHYLHKALFSPTKSAMLQAVKDGHLITCPGLMEDDINKHLKLTPATAMGRAPLMISITNWCHLTAIDATPRNAPSGLSRNSLWPGSPRLTPPSRCTCGKDSCHKWKLR